MKITIERDHFFVSNPGIARALSIKGESCPSAIQTRHSDDVIHLLDFKRRVCRCCSSQHSRATRDNVRKRPECASTPVGPTCNQGNSRQRLRRRPVPVSHCTCLQLALSVCSQSTFATCYKQGRKASLTLLFGVLDDESKPKLLPILPHHCEP